MVVVWHHKGAHTFDLEVKIIDGISLWVQHAALREEMLLHPRADPGKENFIARLTKEFKLSKVLLVDLFANLES